jgi:hypothetical protein
VQETAGKAGPLRIALTGYTKATQTDLLERDLRGLSPTADGIGVDLNASGFASVRLLP